jgi:Helix-turn-helix domain
MGLALRRARESLGLTLAEIHDRTGVPWQQLEGLEEMDLAGLPDQRTVVVAARRYAEVVGLDASEVCGTMLRAWQDVRSDGYAVAVPRAPTSSRLTRRHRSGAALSSRSRSARSVSRADHASTSTQPHLLSFSQTAEVPFVPGRGVPAVSGRTAMTFSDTDLIMLGSLQDLRPRAPLWLRLTMGLAACLLLVAIGGLAIQHYEPKWLNAIHLTHQPSTPSPHTTPSTPSATQIAGSHGSSKSVIIPYEAGEATATIAVRSDNYEVVVTAQQPCWIQATASGGSASVYSGLLGPGETKLLAPVSGTLSVNFGASYVSAHVQIAGKAVSGWSFKPSTAPFTLSFQSVSTS